MSRQTRQTNGVRKQSRGRVVPARPGQPLQVDHLEDRLVPGTLTYSRTIFFGGPTSVAAVAGDVTGDGVRDFVIANGSSFRILNGTNEAQLASFIAFPAPASGTLKFAVGDVTGDGKADIQVWGKLAGVSTQVYKLYDAATLLGVPPAPPVVPPTLPPTLPPVNPPTVPPAGPPTGTFGNTGSVVEGGTASVRFTQASDPLGQALTYAYDFGNDGSFEVTGSTSATAALSSVLTADGPRTVPVRGRVTAADGRFTDYTTQVQVTNAPPVAAAGAGYAGTQGQAVAFQGSATDPSAADVAAGFSYAWNFGDGTTGTGTAPTHTYTAAGTFTVTLSVTDKDGATGVSTSTAKVSAAATPVGLLGNSGSVTEGGTGSVAYTQVSDPLGQSLTYSFDFGNDGSFEVTGSTTATAALSSVLTADGPRTVPVRGRVTAADGRFTDSTTQIQVANAPPAATATGPVIVQLNSAAAFTGTATDPSAADVAAGFKYAWNFGDGTTGTGAAANHTYSKAGSFTVSLSVTDKDGGVGTATRSVTVVDPTQSSSGIVVTQDWIVTRYERIPNFGGRPTLVAAQSGPWSDPNTWGGRLPAAGEIVAIGAGKTVTYDLVNDVKHDTVSIESGGTLQFRPDASTRLRVTNLMVLEGGTLTVGTAAAPVLAGVKAELIINDLPLDTTRDPQQFGHGLIAFGKVTVHGAVLSDTFVRLAAEPRAGDTTLTLSVPVTGWRAGDKVAVPDTRQLVSATRPDTGGAGYVPQWETLTIASISPDGRTVTLTAPLVYDHFGARDGAGHLDLLPHVANYTRNVQIKSESSLGTRGHTLFTGRADVDIRFAQFAGLGRTTINPLDNTKLDAAGNVTAVGTNQTDRYSVNFYHLRGPATAPANGYQFTFEGNSVVCLMNQFQFRWGVAVRDSHYGLVSENVVYNWAGAGIVAGQSGNETGNVIAGNYVSRIQGTGGRADDRGNNDTGHEGAGIWSRSPANFVRDNVVSNARHAYTLWMDGLTQVNRPAFVGADTAAAGQFQVVDAQNSPIREFARNEAYGGATEIGITIWSLGTASYTPYANAQESVIKDFKVWNVWAKGFYNYKTNRLTFDGLIARGDSGALAAGNGATFMFFAGDYAWFNFKVVNSDIQGFLIGYLNNAIGNQEIRDTYMRNYLDIVVSPMWWLSSADLLPARRLTVTNVRFDVMNVPGQGSFGPKGAISMFGSARGDHTTLVTTDEVFIYDYNGDPTKDYRLYYNEQAASYVLPQTQLDGAGQVLLFGAPAAGLTNAQAWTQYGVAWGGAVAPANAITLPGISGLVETI